MKKLGWIMLAAMVALAAGFAGSVFHKWAEIKEVEAQPQRAPQGIRIAVVNLEEVARRSPMFGDRKLRWDRNQKALEDERARIDKELQDQDDRLRRAIADARTDDELIQMRTELETLRKHRERVREDHQMYMAALLSKYQKEVLQDVRPEIERYAQIQQFDIVLQDYSVEETEGLFSGDAYAQTLINKPVLFVPGLRDGKNPYVTDITEAIINRLHSRQPGD